MNSDTFAYASDSSEEVSDVPQKKRKIIHDEADDEESSSYISPEEVDEEAEICTVETIREMLDKKFDDTLKEIADDLRKVIVLQQDQQKVLMAALQEIRTDITIKRLPEL